MHDSWGRNEANTSVICVHSKKVLTLSNMASIKAIFMIVRPIEALRNTGTKNNYKL